MTSKGCALLSLFFCILAVLALPPAGSGQMTKNPLTIKIGYFDSGKVKASYPEAAGAEALRAQAESQLDSDLEQANAEIEKLLQTKQPREAIQRAREAKEEAISEKKHALKDVLDKQVSLAYEKLEQAAAQVAAEKGLDLILDANGLFVGRENILNNGTDVTEDLVRKLSSIGQGSQASNQGE